MKSTEVKTPKDLSQMLVEAEVITKEQLQHVTELQRKSGDKFERVLLRQRLLTPQQLALFISLQLGIPGLPPVVVPLSKLEPPIV